MKYIQTHVQEFNRHCVNRNHCYKQTVRYSDTML